LADVGDAAYSRADGKTGPFRSITLTFLESQGMRNAVLSG